MESYNLQNSFGSFAPPPNQNFDSGCEVYANVEKGREEPQNTKQDKTETFSIGNSVIQDKIETKPFPMDTVIPEEKDLRQAVRNLSIEGFADLIKTLLSNEKPSILRLESVSFRKESLIRIEKLGEGSFGEVYRVYDRDNFQSYACKQSKQKGTRLEEQEFKVLSRIQLEGKNLIRVVKLEKEPFYAFLEYGDGTLKHFLDFMQEKEKAWEKEDIMELYLQLEDQAKELRDMGLCHRDIKPANIIISRDGRFLLTDFGLAQVLEKEGVQEMRVEGTERYFHDTIKNAFKAGKKTCHVDPYEADVASIRKTIKDVMNLVKSEKDKEEDQEEDKEEDKVTQLLSKYPNFQKKGKISIYERFKTEYKVYLFDSLYKKLEFEQKFQNLAFFLNYFAYTEIAGWLRKRADEFKHTRNEKEKALICFFIALLFSRNGKSKEALGILIGNEDKVLLLDDKQFVCNYYDEIGQIARLNYQFSLAKKYLKKHLKLSKEYFGEQSSRVGYALRRLGQFEHYRGNRTKALKYYKKMEKVPRDNYNEQSKAITYEAMGRYDKAEYCFKKFLEGLRVNELHTHSDYADGLNGLGKVYYELGNIKESLKCFHESIEVRTKISNSDDLGVARSRIYMATLHRYNGQNKEALEDYEASLTILEKNTDDNPVIDTAKYIIAEFYFEIKKYVEANKLLKNYLEKFEKATVEDRSRMIIVWINWELDLKKKAQPKRAYELYKRRILSWNKSPGIHPGLDLIEEKLATIRRTQGQQEKNNAKV